MKIYVNDTKYSGRKYSFIFKPKIFHDICLKANVLPKAKIKIFLIMLKDLALDYYYFNISTSDVVQKFYQVYNLIRNYFEETKYK